MYGVLRSSWRALGVLLQLGRCPLSGAAWFQLAGIRHHLESPMRHLLCAPQVEASG